MNWQLRVVLVTGSRDHDDGQMVWDALDAFRGPDDEVLVVHGGARGADQFAREWAEKKEQPRAVFPANWNRYSRGAGPRRNRQMAHTIRPNLVLAFPGPTSVGTWDMVRVAEELGLIVEVKR